MTDADVVYNKLAFERAFERAKHNPLDLEPRDFVLLKAFGHTGLVKAADDAQRRAGLALLPSMPLQTKSNDSPAAQTSRAAKHEALADAVVAAVKPVLESYQTKLAALDARRSKPSRTSSSAASTNRARPISGAMRWSAPAACGLPARRRARPPAPARRLGSWPSRRGASDDARRGARHSGAAIRRYR
jgi:hypothetical protein